MRLVRSLGGSNSLPDRDPDARDESWCMYHGYAHVGTIGHPLGAPNTSLRFANSPYPTGGGRLAPRDEAMKNRRVTEHTPISKISRLDVISTGARRRWDWKRSNGSWRSI